MRRFSEPTNIHNHTFISHKNTHIKHTNSLSNTLTIPLRWTEGESIRDERRVNLSLNVRERGKDYEPTTDWGDGGYSRRIKKEREWEKKVEMV
jgi:hypothetical protein